MLYRSEDISWISHQLSSIDYYYHYYYYNIILEEKTSSLVSKMIKSNFRQS